MVARLASSVSRNGDSERRGTLRIEVPFPATVCGRDRNGEQFRLDTVLDSLSTSDLHVRLPLRIEVGQPLFVVWFLVLPAQHATSPGVAVRGVVLEVEPRPGNIWGVRIGFTRHRFLYVNII